MLIKDRQEKIFTLINNNTRLSFAQLMQEVKISESTLRRDLNELQKKGLITLVRGGAESTIALIGRGEELIDRRYTLNSNEKTIIGKYAVSLIQPNDIVFIDAGSTTEKMCEFIKEYKAKYVTIGLKHALELSNRGLNALIAPGKIKRITEGIQGSFTLEFLQKFNFTLAFFGSLGITSQGGISTTDEEDAIIKASVIKRCPRSYVLCDHSKFGVDTAVSFASIDSVSIITNSNTNTKQYENYTNIIYADKYDNGS